MIETDVLVIGGGPAGSSAAKHAALGGAKVILVDKRSEIGAPKRCAEGVSKKGLAKLGIEPSPRWITKEIDGVRLTSPDGIDVWLTEEENEVKYFFYFSPQTPTLQQHHSYSFYIKKRNCR